MSEPKTLLSLPPELLLPCLLLPSRRYGHDCLPPLPPKNALLVCRHLYRVAAPRLYAHLLIDTHAAAELGPSPLIPLLTAQQRSDLSLRAWPRMADPAWVHDLTIKPSEPREVHDAALCRVLALVLPAMALRSLRWEGRQRDTSMSRAVAQLGAGLETVCCRVGGPLWHSGLPGLTEVVAWHDEALPYDADADTGGTGLLQASADTVKTLHLAVGYEFDGIARVARRVLAGVRAMPGVRVLRLTGFTADAVAAVERVVAFAAVEEFQLMRGVGLDGLRGKDLSSARSLAGNATVRGLVALLNDCPPTGRLRDLLVKFVGSETPPPPNSAVVDAVGRHGAALTALLLAHDAPDGHPTDVVALRAAEVARLVQVCPAIEDLSIKVHLNEILEIAPLLGKLPLSHLTLSIVYASPDNDFSTTAPYHLAASATNPPRRLDPAGFPITPLEAAISHLLTAAPACLQTIDLAIANAAPGAPRHHNLRNRYELRAGTDSDRRPRGPGEFVHSPPGQRYACGAREFVAVSWDRFRGGRARFVSAAWWTGVFEGGEMP